MGVVGDAIGQAVAGLIGSAGKTAIDIRTAIDGISPDKKAEITILTANLEAAALKAQTDLLSAQSEVNKVEAASTNFFIAGWRPLIGWICGTAILYSFIVSPLFGLPKLEMAELWTLITGMLGLAGARSAEKIAGVAR
jgi:hypothetical protein